MNYKYFEKPKNDGTETKEEKFIKAVPGSGKSFSAKSSDIHSGLVDEYESFIEISKILARQEYKKRRFYRNLKKAVFAISSIFVFFIFAKKRKSGKCEKTTKGKN